MKSNLEVDILCARVLTFPFPHFHLLAARCLDWIGNQHDGGHDGDGDCHDHGEVYNAVDVCNENATDDGDGDDDDGDGCNDVDILCASTSLTFADTPKDSLIGFW